MTEPDNDKTIDLSRTAKASLAWEAWTTAKAKETAVKREVARARRALDEILGENETIKILGEEVASYRNDGAFNQKRFTDDLPHIAAQYTAWKASEVFDVDKFKAENPALYEQYRSRTLRVKDDE